MRIVKNRKRHGWESVAAVVRELGGDTQNPMDLAGAKEIALERDREKAIVRERSAAEARKRTQAAFAARAAEAAKPLKFSPFRSLAQKAA